jgi:predicted DNA binding CopG/RHH family protein
MSSEFHFDAEEAELLAEIATGEWQATPLNSAEQQQLKQSAAYTKSLQEKRQTTIRFSVNDLAAVKAKSKELGISYQNIIQALVHNYATGKIKLEL